MSKTNSYRQVELLILSYLPSALWAGLIFFLSDQQLLPGLGLSAWDFIAKKLAHMFVYAVLYYLLFWAYRRTHQQSPLSNKNYWWPLAIALIYAASDEIHQSFVSGRTATLRDFAYDALGMITVLLHQQNLL